MYLFLNFHFNSNFHYYFFSIKINSAVLNTAIVSCCKYSSQC